MKLDKTFKERFSNTKSIVGMVHVQALPGTPNNKWSPNEIVNYAINEAKVLRDCGIDILMIENMHDIPYTKNPGPEVSSLMSIIGYEIKKLGLYCGIQILAGANREALSSAYASGLDFIRAEGFVYAHVADEGYIESCAGDLLRYRKAIGADDVMVFTDIKKKHSSHAITCDVSISETAKTAEFFMSDGVIVTGESTGAHADVNEVKAVRESVKIPVLIGSGITATNLKEYFNDADLFIVGSYIKKEGYWKNKMDVERIDKLVTEFERLKTL
jgi:membrane complex biogenesis BtpA family protein